MRKLWPATLLAALWFFTSFAGTGQEKKKTAETITAGSEAPAPQANKPDYSQEPFVVEQFYNRVRFENDGTGRRELAVRIRVQSEAGVQQLGQLVFGYSSANERLEVDAVEVRRADGSITAASSDAVRDMTSPVARDAPV